MTDFVTIVSGLPRSGTSLMMQMLAAGGMPVLSDGVRTPDHDNPRGYHEFEPVKQTKQNPAWVAEAQGKAVKMVYLLLRDLPPGFEYRVILMRRDLKEVIASQRAMLLRLGRTGADVSGERMAAIFEEQLKAVCGWVGKQANFSMIEMGHRDCINAPGAAAARVNAFLDGRLDEGAMAAAIDPALYRQVRDGA